MVMRILISCFFVFSFFIAEAQYTFFPNSGTITYESKFHIQNYLKRNVLNKSNLNVWDNVSVDYITKNGPSEIITKHTLRFFGDETVFETVKEDYPRNYSNAMSYLPMFAESKTYVNYGKNEFMKLLPFGDDELLMKDTIPYVKWKYTDEYRNIAGYDCRRANGVMQDSIYVVAFFTNQLALPAGPELIQGLPGVILGISIPELNINMFATQVQLTNEPVSAQLTKKKKVVAEDPAVIFKKLRTSVYDWYSEKDFQKVKSKILF